MPVNMPVRGVGTGIQAGAAKLSARRQAVKRVIAGSLSDKRAQTQTALLQAGRTLFTEKGIGATSVGDICSHAGFTRGAFYSNFTDMDHFVHKLAQEQWSSMTAFVRAAFNEAIGGETITKPLDDEQTRIALSELADRLLTAMPVSREYYMLLNEFVCYILRSEHEVTPLRESYQEFKITLRDLLTQGLEAIGRECILSPDDTVELLLGAAERSMRVALLTETEQGLTDQLDRTLPILLSHLTQLTRPQAA